MDAYGRLMRDPDSILIYVEDHILGKLLYLLYRLESIPLYNGREHITSRDGSSVERRSR